MTPKGILMSGAMVRALLDGRKSQTRREVKPQPRSWHRFTGLDSWGVTAIFQDLEGEHPAMQLKVPHQPGDVLFVRETFQRVHEGLLRKLDPEPDNGTPFNNGWSTVYRADGEPANWEHYGLDWKPSTFMPRSAARIWLRVEKVRVEKLGDISEEDAEAEGVESPDAERYGEDWKICPRCGGTRLHQALSQNLGVINDVDCTQCDTHKKRYQHLWTSLHGTWNPALWCWVYDLKRIDKPNE